MFKLVLNKPKLIKRISVTGTRPHIYQFRCKCGKLFNSSKSNVNTGHTKSCGCARIEGAIKSGITQRKHGHFIGNKPTPTYISWQAMLARCENPKHKAYHIYKYIKICKEWHIFNNFLVDMGERPVNLTIERIDNKKGYYKQNCRWASRLEQARNTTKNIRFLWQGRKLTIKEIFESLDAPVVNLSTISTRIFTLGWDLTNAVNTPPLIKRFKK